MENLTAKQKYLIAAGAVLLMIIGFIFLQFTKKDDIVIDQGVEAAETQKEEASQTPKPAEPKKVIVHVTGQVMRPGIVELQEGCRVNDAVSSAGGATKLADVEQLNLAAQVSDGEKIYVPKKGEKIANEAVNAQSGSNGSVININSATKEDLDRIPGVGPSTAEKIIEYRKIKGTFKRIEDIKNVSGIGDKKFEKIKKYIRT